MKSILIIVAGAALIAACDDTTSNNTNPDLAVSVAPTCAAYCATIHTSCGFDTDPSPGPNVQYSSIESCLGACKAFPVGTTADSSGNTLGCRATHAGLAKTDPATHCKHAGPGGAGMCGSDCEGFCEIAQMYCTAANMAQVYSSLSDCMAVCAATPDDVNYTTAVQDGAHVACFLYHVQEAASTPKQNPADHCANAMGTGDLQKIDGGSKSVTCM